MENPNGTKMDGLLQSQYLFFMNWKSKMLATKQIIRINSMGKMLRNLLVGNHWIYWKQTWLKCFFDGTL